MSRTPAGAATAVDAVALTRALIRCASVTPRDDGALDTLTAALEPLGFRCERMTFSEAGTPDVDNLHARLGDGAPHLCFAGHTDVVPAGDAAAWTVAPFAGELRDGMVHGRGAADMKGAIGAFVAAVAAYLARHGPPPGSLSLLITGDEEGPSINGTRKVLERLAARGERLDACIVGEPTCPETLGEMIKIGRRGSMNVRLTARGVQGHTAYPQLADNPVHRLVAVLHALTGRPLDDGSAHFEPSTLQVTTVDVGNPARNVIPARATAEFNIRFNDRQDAAGLERLVRAACDRAGGSFDVAVENGGENFLSPPGPLSDMLAAAVRDELGIEPALGTTGGTSDARFIRTWCPVAEFGLVGRTMHQVDERVAAADIAALSRVYLGFLERYFAGTAGGGP